MGNILNNNNDDSLSYQFDNKLAEVFDAIPNGDMEKIANYIQSGKNLDLTDDRFNNHKGDTLLLRAVEYRDADIVRMLIDAGANPNLVNEKTGQTPLYIAAGNEDLFIMNMLIRGGADVNQLAGQGMYGRGTALHIAAVMGKSESVRLLLENGIDRDIRTTVENDPDMGNLTACNLAEIRGYSEIVEMLCYQNDNSSDEENNFEVDEIIDEDRRTGRRLDFDNFFNFNDSSLDAIVEDLL